MTKIPQGALVIFLYKDVEGKLEPARALLEKIEIPNERAE
jgi:hypothetical protein